MPDLERDERPAVEPEAPSKSAVKRRLLALQELGKSLTRLSDKQLQRLPVDDERLLEAIREARSMRSNSARRRHLQLIGKLLRSIDTAAIEAALDSMFRSHQADTNALHELEQLREDILDAGIAGVELAMTHWPQADRQQLRQLLLQHQREMQRGKSPAASRKLFKYLRQLQELYG